MFPNSALAGDQHEPSEDIVIIVIDSPSGSLVSCEWTEWVSPGGTGEGEFYSNECELTLFLKLVTLFLKLVPT